MKGVLLRVGCDATPKGGNWNAPVNVRSFDYVYVPIAGNESKYKHLGSCPTYGSLSSALERLGVGLPPHLTPDTKLHLDPDFSSLTFGEPYRDKSEKLSSRGETLNKLDPGDFIAFFAGFQPLGGTWQSPLAYCLFGLLYVKAKTFVRDLSSEARRVCAHGRRKGAENDLVIWGDQNASGRFQKAIPIGSYRDGAYRVTRELLNEWGDISVKDGYIQRSARPPFFLNPKKFIGWLNHRKEATSLLNTNW